MASRSGREFRRRNQILFTDSEGSESDNESDDEIPQNGETDDESTSDEVEVRVIMIFIKS